MKKSNQKTKKQQHKSGLVGTPISLGRSGFTLIEMIVAVAIFVVVVVIAAGALLSLITANRKAQSIKSVMNNVNFAVESMARSIRVGTNYSISGTNGAPTFTFHDTASGQTVTYNHDGQNLSIEKNIGGNGYIDITAPEVVIDNLRFYVYGEDSNDSLQPYVIIVVQGHTGEMVKTRTDFDIQTVVSQRALDE